MTTSGAKVETVFQFMTEVGILAQLSNTALQRVMPDKMTPSQFGLLNHLTRLGGSHAPLQLAKAMQVTKGTMTNTLGHLEAAGLVAIAPDPLDGRAKLVTVTSAGIATRDAAIAAVAPLLAGVAAGLEADELAAGLHALRKVRQYLDALRD